MLQLGSVDWICKISNFEPNKIMSIYIGIYYVYTCKNPKNLSYIDNINNNSKLQLWILPYLEQNVLKFMTN